MTDTIETTEKLLNFTEEQIQEYLVNFKKCIREGRYTISLNDNRVANKSFIEDYNINSAKQSKILLSLNYLDFCYAANNINPRFKHEILYIFNKEYKLDFWGEEKSIDIYIKINMLSRPNGDYAIVVSLHERNKDINYLFRR